MIKLQSISSRDLCNALKIASKCIVKKNSLAILDNVLLQNVDGKFVFTAATIDSQLTIDAPLTLVDGALSKPIAFSPDIIISYLSSLSDCVVNISIDDNLVIALSYCQDSGEGMNTGDASIVGIDGSDFPLNAQKMENTTKIVVPNDIFTKAFKQAEFFVANDELRPALCTLCIDIDEDATECNFVATDGLTIIKMRHDNKTEAGKFLIEGSAGKFLVHKNHFKSLSAFFGNENINIEANNKFARFYIDGIELICKSVDTKYPNYASIIPANSTYYIDVRKSDLIESISRVSIFCDKNSPTVVLTKNGDTLLVIAKDIAMSTSSNDNINICNADCADGFSIGLSSARFLPVLKAIDEDIVRLHFNGKETPVLVTSTDSVHKVLTLCMPVRI